MEMTQRQNKMAILPIPKLLISMAIPLMLSMLVQSLYNIVDSMFVSFINDNEVSFNAVSLANSIQMLLIAVGTGIGVGMNSLISRSLGENNHKKANRYTHAGFLLAVVFWIIFVILGIAIPRPFFESQTDFIETINAGESYLRIVLCGSIFIFIQFCGERMLQATGRTNLSMIAQIAGALTNIILDPIFIFSFNMGIEGAAYATIIGQAVGALCAVILNIKCNSDVSLLKKDDSQWVDFASIKGILTVGIPSMIMVAISSVLGFGINVLLKGFSASQGEEIVKNAQNAYGAYVKLQSFVTMPLMGLNNALVPIVAFHYGAKNKNKMKQSLKLSIVLGLIIMIIGFMLFQIAPGILLKIFNANGDMLIFGETTLRIISINFLFVTFGICLSSWFQALGKSIYSMFVSLFRQLIGILPIAYLFSLFNDIQLIWWAFPIAELLGTVLSVIIYFTIDKKILANIERS